VTSRPKGMRTLILGLGNPARGDDGVGIRVAQECRRRIDAAQATVVEDAPGGLGLLDIVPGHDRLIVIDAVQTVEGMPGRVYRLSLEAIEGQGNLPLVHDVPIATVLRLGREIGLEMPRETVIFAIEAAETGVFTDELTPAVGEAVPVCVEAVLRELDQAAGDGGKGHSKRSAGATSGGRSPAPRIRPRLRA
jgi:hydrogenase maturation protease